MPGRRAESVRQGRGGTHALALSVDAGAGKSVMIGRPVPCAEPSSTPSRRTRCIAVPRPRVLRPPRTARACGDRGAPFVQRVPRMDSKKALDELLVACADDEHLLRHEKSRVDPKRAALLARLADERHAFVTALGALPAAHEQHGDVSWKERLRERMIDFRGVMTGPSTTDAISVCRESSARLARAYEEALELPWPPGAHELLEAQRACVLAEQDELLHVQF